MNQSKMNYNSHESAEIKIIPDYKDENESENLNKETNQYYKETSETDHTKQEEDEDSFSDAPYLMTVEIGNTQSKKLKIYHDSIPEELAFEFLKEIKKILQQDKNSIKADTENNINFSETIQEVDEEYINSDLNRKESSEKVKGIEDREQIFGNRKEILFIDGKNPDSGNKEENGKSKKSHSPFFTENNSYQGDNGLLDVKKKKPVKIGSSKADLRGKKSKSMKTFNSIKKSNPLPLSDNINNSHNNKENRLKSDFELRCERIKKLREMKAYFSNAYKSQFLSPPPIYDFSILKSRILGCSNLIDQSTNYKRNKEEVVKKIKDKYELHEEKPNFSPKINIKSDKIINDKIHRSPDNNIFSNLYDLAKKRSARLATLRNEYHDKLDFKPLLNTNLPISSTFDERQKAFCKRVEEKRKKLNQELLSYYEKTSRNNICTSRGPSNERRNINIHEMLYNKGQNYLLSKEKMKKEQLDQIFLNANKIFTTPITQNILNVQKKEAFKKMFLLLDTDQDREISIYNIDLGKIPESIKIILNPIVTLMASKKTSIKEEKFYEELENIFSNLNYDKQRMFLNFTKKAIVEPIKAKFDHKVNLKYRLYTSKLTSSMTSSKSSSKSIVDIMTKRLNIKMQ